MLRNLNMYLFSLSINNHIIKWNMTHHQMVSRIKITLDLHNHVTHKNLPKS